MKRSRTLTALVRAVLGMLLALSVAGASDVRAAGAVNAIAVQNQDINTGIVVVDSVTAAQPGWVVIYKGTQFTREELVGYAPVHAGTNLGVKVVVSLPLIGARPMLWAVLQADNGVPGVFEWGLNDLAYNDGPVMADKRPVTATFTTSKASAVTPVSPLADKITISNQRITSGQIVIDAVTATQNGWVVVYRNPNFTAGEIVGYAPVYRGTNTNVKMTIDTAKVGTQATLWAQLHTDDGLRTVFEWGHQAKPFSDWPVVQKGHYVTTSFATTAAPVKETAPASAVDRIVIRDQNLNTGVIVVDAVTVTQNGWVVIYRDANLTSGQIVGYAPVYKGTNQTVRVTIDTTKLADQPILWAQLHTDDGLQGVFEWGYKSEAFSDSPIYQNGQNVEAAFGVSPP